MIIEFTRENGDPVSVNTDAIVRIEPIRGEGKSRVAIHQTGSEPIVLVTEPYPVVSDRLSKGGMTIVTRQT